MKIEDIKLCTGVEQPRHVNGRNPRFSNTTERRNNHPFVAVLNILCDVVLDACWVWQVEMLPDNEEELAKICRRVRLCHMRTMIELFVYASVFLLVAFSTYAIFDNGEDCTYGRVHENCSLITD